MSLPVESELQIIGAITADEAIALPVVEALINRERIDMSYGNDFTGKPGTKVYASDEYILKVKSDITLEGKVALRWVAERLAKERALGVYHPSKTWLLVGAEGGYSPANVCRRLEPLHLSLADAKYTLQEKTALLLRLFAFYLKFSKGSELRMDEGLSNFALDSDEALYYIDDDIYQWDDFGMFSHALGIYFRSLDVMANEGAVRVLAEGLREQIAEQFAADPIWFSVIAEQLHHEYVPDELRAVVATFIATLHPQTVHHPRSSARHDYLVVMADIHANSWAFKEVLRQLQREGISQGIIAGDIVGYGPEPNECVELAAESGLTVVQGNHDYAISRGVVGRGFTASAQWSFDWTMSVISQQSRQWLAALPPLYETDGFMVVHGAPVDPTFINAYVYQMTYESNLNWMQQNKVGLCFHGHSHIQGAYLRDRQFNDSNITEGAVQLAEKSICLLCPGSVGQPREPTIGAQYAIYDVRRERITFHAVPYDKVQLQQRMRDYDFPERLQRMFEPPPGQGGNKRVAVVEGATRPE